MKKICIIGAGVTGLGAACRLAEAGNCALTVIEREPAVGGLAASLKREGLATDLGPHRLYTELPEIKRLLPELLGERMIKVQRKSAMLLEGGYVAYPIQPLELARALGPWKPASYLGSFFWQAAFGRGDREASFAAWMNDAFGPALYRDLFEPYIAKTWKRPPEELDADIARVRLSVGGLRQMFGDLLKGRRSSDKGALKEFHYVKGGIGGLIEALRQRAEAAGAKMLTGATPVEIQQGESGAITRLVVKQGDETLTVDADAVVSTVPLPTLLPLLLKHRAEPVVDAALKRLRYLALTLVCLVVKRERISENSWLYFPGCDIVFNRAYEAKNFDESMGAPGRSLLCCEVTRPREEQGDSAWLIEQTIEQLIRSGLFKREELLDAFTHEVDWAYPIYHLGYRAELEQVVEYLKTWPNLLSVGRQGLFNHNNMDHCLAMGRAAADCLTMAEGSSASESPAAAWGDCLSCFDHFRIVD